MPKIKHVANAQTFVVTQNPVLVDGIWECGSARFTDPTGTEYVPMPDLPELTPMSFYLAFTPQERVAIKASTDALVKEFWTTFELAMSSGTHVNPNLDSVVNGLQYLVSQTLITEGRVNDILNGVAQ